MAQKLTRRAFRTALLLAGLALSAGLTGSTGLRAETVAGPPMEALPAEYRNFGFPVGFSVDKMDPAVDPRRDFARYAAGRWLDAAKIPGDTVRISGFEVLGKQVELQLKAILEEASRTSATASKGSPLQQVGDFYASGMDEKRLAELGVAPLRPELDRIAAVDSPKTLAEALARLCLITNDVVLAGILVSTDTQDRSRYAVYAGDGELPMGLDNYLKAETAPIREGYREMVTAKLVLAGSTPVEAKAIAAKVLEMETRIARKKLTPVEQRDPGKRFVKMPFAELRTLLSNVDLDAYLKAIGLPAQEEIIVTEADALRERNAMLAEYPLADTKDYLRWELLKRASPYLTPAFVEPTMAFARVMYGQIDTPPRAKLVATGVTTTMGHPLSQLYVTKLFPAETKKAVEDLIGRIRAEFRTRLENNAWLSPETRRQALEKLDRSVISVGYPQTWIDYSGVDIRRDDYLGNALRLNEFSVRRDLARLGKPVVEDAFAIPGTTLPIDINAGYSPGKNKIEIPAAFLQPPFYDVKADAAVNYCTIGAVIGHEITHGFDSQGRLFDAAGNVRDWWTEADAKNFVAEAQKLVAQAGAYEVLPGLRINGQLAVGENLADVGGVAMAYAALKGYLKDHPEAGVKVDGLTPEQRCFLGWAQLWADKTNEGYLKQVVPTDPHPPGLYRMAAPAQHERGFFEAFGIRAGDPMWLDEKARVRIW